MATSLHQTTNLVKTNGESEPASHYDDLMIVLTLNENGMIRECSNTSGRLLGYLSDWLVGQHISVILPQLAKTALMRSRQINPRLRYLAHIGHPFEVMDAYGHSIASKLFFNDIEIYGTHQLRLLICPTEQEPDQVH